MPGNNHDFHKLWTGQLSREHHRICWQHRVNLLPPLIEITTADSYWGKWQPSSRTIAISEKLIRLHPWEVVLNVFRHEMAHQLVSTENGAGCHDGDFLRACDRLGVPEEYRSAGGKLPLSIPLPDPLAHDRTGALLEKVRKLLALSESANENEAGLAMRKARELLERHGLPNVAGTASHCSRIINLKKKRLASHHRLLATLLMDFFQVEVILGSTFDQFTGQDQKCLDLLGRPGQVKVAEYVFHFLEQCLARLWKEQRRQNATITAGGRNSFYLGVLKGFREKLSLDCRKSPEPFQGTGDAPAGQLPVPGPDPARDRFLALRYPRLRSSRQRAVRVDGELYLAGRQKGRSLELHAGLENSGDGKKRQPVKAITSGHNR